MIDVKDLKSKLTYDTHDIESPISPGYFIYESDIGPFGGLVETGNTMVGGTPSKYPFTEYGFETLCKVVEGQKKFLMSLKNEVRQRVINEKLSTMVDKPVTIRCIKEDGDYNIRSIISRNWTEFDNLDVVSTIEPMLDTYGMRVESVEMDNYRMDLRAVFDSDLGFSNDSMNIGLSIVNDECSSKPLSIDLLIFRQVCSNGMIVRYDTRNLGSIPHARITSENFASKLSMILTSTQSNVQFIVNAFNAMKNKSLDLETLKVMQDKWQKYYRIPKKMLKESVDNIPTTYYDLINGITESARDYDNMNARRRGEISAGNVLLDIFCESEKDMSMFDQIFVKQSRGRPRKDTQEV